MAHQIRQRLALSERLATNKSRMQQHRQSDFTHDRSYKLQKWSDGGLRPAGLTSGLSSDKDVRVRELRQIALFSAVNDLKKLEEEERARRQTRPIAGQLNSNDNARHQQRAGVAASNSDQSTGLSPDRRDLVSRLESLSRERRSAETPVPASPHQSALNDPHSTTAGLENDAPAKGASPKMSDEEVEALLEEFKGGPSKLTPVAASESSFLSRSKKSTAETTDKSMAGHDSQKQNDTSAAAVATKPQSKKPKSIINKEWLVSRIGDSDFHPKDTHHRSPSTMKEAGAGGKTVNGKSAGAAVMDVFNDGESCIEELAEIEAQEAEAAEAQLTQRALEQERDRSISIGTHQAYNDVVDGEGDRFSPVDENGAAPHFPHKTSAKTIGSADLTTIADDGSSVVASVNSDEGSHVPPISSPGPDNFLSSSQPLVGCSGQLQGRDLQAPQVVRQVLMNEAELKRKAMAIINRLPLGYTPDDDDGLHATCELVRSFAVFGIGADDRSMHVQKVLKVGAGSTYGMDEHVIVAFASAYASLPNADRKLFAMLCPRIIELAPQLIIAEVVAVMTAAARVGLEVTSEEEVRRMERVVKKQIDGHLVAATTTKSGVSEAPLLPPSSSSSKGEVGDNSSPVDLENALQTEGRSSTADVGPDLDNDDSLSLALAAEKHESQQGSDDGDGHRNVDASAFFSSLDSYSSDLPFESRVLIHEVRQRTVGARLFAAVADNIVAWHKLASFEQFRRTDDAATLFSSSPKSSDAADACNGETMKSKSKSPTTSTSSSSTVGGQPAPTLGLESPADQVLHCLSQIEAQLPSIAQRSMAELRPWLDQNKRDLSLGGLVNVLAVSHQGHRIAEGRSDRSDPSSLRINDECSAMKETGDNMACTIRPRGRAAQWRGRLKSKATVELSLRSKESVARVANDSAPSAHVRTSAVRSTARLVDELSRKVHTLTSASISSSPSSLSSSSSLSPVSAEKLLVALAGAHRDLQPNSSDFSEFPKSMNTPVSLSRAIDEESAASNLAAKVINMMAAQAEVLSSQERATVAAALGPFRSLPRCLEAVRVLEAN